MDWRIAVADVQPTAALLKTFKDNLENHSARLLLCHCLLMMDSLIGAANEQTKQFIYRVDSSCVNEDLCGRCKHATDASEKGRQGRQAGCCFLLSLTSPELLPLSLQPQRPRALVESLPKQGSTFGSSPPRSNDMLMAQPTRLQLNPLLTFLTCAAT